MMSGFVKTAKIAIIPGDGIGPEIINQALKIFEALQQKIKLPIEYVQFPYNADYFLKTHIALPDAFLEELQKSYNAVLVGTLGDKRIADNRHAKEIINKMRYKLDLFLAVNRVKIYGMRYFPLKKDHLGPVDILLLRENYESSQPRLGGSIYAGTTQEIVHQTFIETQQAVRRFLQTCLKYCQQNGRNRVILIHKNNLYPYSYDLWAKVMQEECANTSISFELMHADILLYELLENPDKHNSIICPGIFGETIYTSLLFLQGGFGFAHIAELNPDNIGVFRITQSSSPGLVGRGFANPIGVFLTVIEMLYYLDMSAAADIVEKALQNLLMKHIVTIDLGGMIGTEEVGNYLVDFINEEIARSPASN